MTGITCRNYVNINIYLRLLQLQYIIFDYQGRLLMVETAIWPGGCYYQCTVNWHITHFYASLSVCHVVRLSPAAKADGKGKMAE